MIYGCSFFQLRFSPENFLFSALFILPLCSIYSFHSKQAFSCSPLFCFFSSPICSLVYFFTPNVSFPCCCSFCMWRHINFALAGWARNKIDVKGPKIWKEGHKSENYHLAGFNLNSVFFCPQVNCSSWVGIPETPWGGGSTPFPCFQGPISRTYFDLIRTNSLEKFGEGVSHPPFFGTLHRNTTTFWNTP